MMRYKTGGGEEAVFSALLSIWQKARKFGITLDYTKSKVILQTFLMEELAGLTGRISVASCDRIRYLLNTIDRFEIGVPKNKIEDLFHAILHDTIKKTYEDYKQNVTPTSEQKQLIIQLISLARRMNFNTDDFPIG
jgi:hypothetical protein